MSDQETYAQLIKQWRADCALMEDPKARTRMLCYAFNWVTSPTAMLTDREHKASWRFARWCKRRLCGRAGWHEMESGRLWA